MTVTLNVNVDHVATLRQARRTTYPDPVEAALACERAGAHGITVHLREDRRHIQDRDVRVLREVVRGTLNLEMAASEEMLAIAEKMRPDHVTLVPEKREELTTEGGIDASRLEATLRPAVARLQDLGMLVSLFIDPDPEQVRAAQRLGVEQVEFNTGEYANALRSGREHHVAALAMAASQASQFGLRVAAGHGLTVQNVGPVAAIGPIVELNIGHAIVADALVSGMGRAVRSMLRAMRRSRRVV